MRPFDLSIDDPNTPQTTTSKTPRDDRKDPSQEDRFARILGGTGLNTDANRHPKLGLEAQLLGTWGTVSSAERGSELLLQARSDRGGHDQVDAGDEDTIDEDTLDDGTDMSARTSDTARAGSKRGERNATSAAALREAVHASASRTLRAADEGAASESSEAVATRPAAPPAR